MLENLNQISQDPCPSLLIIRLIHDQSLQEGELFLLVAFFDLMELEFFTENTQKIQDLGVKDLSCTIWLNYLEQSASYRSV